MAIAIPGQTDAPRPCVRPAVRRAVVILSVLLMTGCRAPAAAPVAAPAPATPAASETPAPAATAPTAPAAAIPDAQIGADIALMIGGNFAEDHIGPKEYAAVLARVDAAPERYARGIAMFIQDTTDDTRLINLHITFVLGQLHARAPAQVMLAARMLRERHARLLVSPIDDGQRERLLDDQPLLVTLGGAIDPPFDDAWKRKEPESVCVAPTPGGQGIKVELSCTCGEIPVCRAALDGNRLHLRVRIDESHPMRCFDCYPGYSTCTLPALAPSQTLQVDVDGRALGQLVVQDSGWLPPGLCLSRKK